jgi:hypothetical protein
MDAPTFRQQLLQELSELFPGGDKTEFRGDAAVAIGKMPADWSAGLLGMPFSDRKAAIKAAVRGGCGNCVTPTRCSNCTVCLMYTKVLEGAKWQLEVVPVMPVWCRQGAICRCCQIAQAPQRNLARRLWVLRRRLTCHCSAVPPHPRMRTFMALAWPLNRSAAAAAAEGESCMLVCQHVDP